MPFRKVENCNQVVKIGMQLKLSLVNVAGNDFVQGNKKLILGKSLLCIIFKILDSTFFLFAIYKFIKVIQVLHSQKISTYKMLSGYWFFFKEAKKL